MAGDPLALAFASLGCAGARWVGVQCFILLAPDFLAGGAQQSAPWMCGGLSSLPRACVSILGTRCVWPLALVHLWCVLSSWELSPCGHYSRELERRVSRWGTEAEPPPHSPKGKSRAW